LRMNTINHQRSGQSNLTRLSRAVVPAILVSLFLVLAEILEDSFSNVVHTTGTMGPSPLVRWDRTAFLLINVGYRVRFWTP